MYNRVFAAKIEELAGNLAIVDSEGLEEKLLEWDYYEEAEYLLTRQPHKFQWVNHLEPALKGAFGSHGILLGEKGELGNMRHAARKFQVTLMRQPA